MDGDLHVETEGKLGILENQNEIIYVHSVPIISSQTYNNMLIQTQTHMPKRRITHSLFPTITILKKSACKNIFSSMQTLRFNNTES